MARREFLMLGTPLDYAKHNIAGYYMSEKLDGIRCFWDGGLSRGIATTSVPWAGILNPKTGQPKKKVKPIATGLWSRYGNPIIAPDWFLNTLPACPLDGELWAGRGNFQLVTSVCKKDHADEDAWRQIQYGIFGTPNIWAVFSDGEVKNNSMLKDIRRGEIERWIRNRDPAVLQEFQYLEGETKFSAELANLNDWIDHTAETHLLIRQTKLPGEEEAARQLVEAQKREVIEQRGEGLFLRCPDSLWTPKRMKTSLKVKSEIDDEGTVVGFTSGRETNKGSKLLGLIGALILDYKGQRLELAGLTNEEREFSSMSMTNHAKENPGQDMPEGTEGTVFRVGDTVTFVYRELSNDGIPKDARYLRKRGTLHGELS